MTDPKKSKVLVADDDEISEAYLGIFLRKMGFMPIRAANVLSGMGVQFRGQSDDASKVLKEYIETNIAEGTRIV